MPVWVRSYNPKGTRCEGSSVLYEMRGRPGAPGGQRGWRMEKGCRATERASSEAPYDPHILGTFYVSFKAIPHFLINKINHSISHRPKSSSKK